MCNKRIHCIATPINGIGVLFLVYPFAELVGFVRESRLPTYLVLILHVYQVHSTTPHTSYNNDVPKSLPKAV